MSRNGSRGTTTGMKKWYRKIPNCKRCKTKKLVMHEARHAGVCGSCFLKLTGERLSIQYTLFLTQEQNHVKGKTLYSQYRVYLNSKVTEALKLDN